jgi:hypothetical protein
VLQLDPLPQTTAAADTNVIGGMGSRDACEILERTLRLYQDAFGLPFTELTVTNAALGNLIGEEHRESASGAAATLPGTRNAARVP